MVEFIDNTCRRLILRVAESPSIFEFVDNRSSRKIEGDSARWVVQANRIDNPQDLTEALLKAKKEAEDDDSSVKGFLTDENLIMTMSEVFTPGMESTASTLCKALLYLIHNPEVQQMLHQELDQVISANRLPELEDKKNLPYLEATLTETLRLSSLVPLPVHSCVSRARTLRVSARSPLGFFVWRVPTCHNGLFTQMKGSDRNVCTLFNVH